MNMGIAVGKIFKRFDIGSLMMFIFCVVLMRQYGWLFHNSPTLWCVCVSVGAGLWFCLETVRQKYLMEDNIDWKCFFPYVIFPLFLFFILHGFFIDHGFDWKKIRYVFGIHGLSGEFVDGSDLFYDFIGGNILSDMVGSLFFQAFGMRLMAVCSFLLVVWASIELHRMCSLFNISGFVRYMAILFSLSLSSIFIFGDSTILDIMAMPLLLQCITLILQNDDKLDDTLFHYLGFCLGLCLALKFTNFIYVVPIGAFLLFRKVQFEKTIRLQSVIIFLLCGIASNLPYAIFGIMNYNDPFYCILSTKFELGYWPKYADAMRKLDGRWGGKTVLESIFWPVVSLFQYERLSEPKVFSFRLFLGFGANLAALYLSKKQGLFSMRLLSGSCLLFGVLWGLSSGYLRYGVVLEVLEGVVISWLICRLWRYRKKCMSCACVALASLCVFQVFYESSLVMSRAMWGRPKQNIFDDYGFTLENLKLLGRDRDWSAMQTDEVQEEFRKVDYWFTTEGGGILMGWAILLRDAPLLDVRTSLARVPAVRANVMAYLDRHKDKQACFLTSSEKEIPKLKKSFEKMGFGLVPGKIVPLKIKLGGGEKQVTNMYLVHLEPVQEQKKKN